ncbi:MAG TPA: hypothetical protein VHG32_09880 [Thermoanaerobaculia bacterium]|jgi:DNA-binding beta-propeller fold protein YncE|nr:hypothetical protein [Thermoanaerobaculia bacterium]
MEKPPSNAAAASSSRSARRDLTNGAGSLPWPFPRTVFPLAVMLLAVLPRLAEAQFTGGGDISLPLGLAFDGAHIWVTNNSGEPDQTGSVTELNASDGSKVGTFPVVKPSALVFDGAHLWISNDAHNFSGVTELDASNGSIVDIATAGGDIDNPRGLAFDGAHIWVANHGFDRNSVTELNASDGSKVGTFTGGGDIKNPVALAFDGAHVWVANVTGGLPGSDSVTALNASDGSKVGTFSAGGDIQQPDALVFDGRHIWVGNLTGNSVTELNASDGSKVGTFTAGGDIYLPTALAFDGKHIWVANGGGLPGKGNSVTELDVRNGKKLATFTTGISNPTALVFDGMRIWVANAGNSSVTVLPGICVPSPSALCLKGNRFRVTAQFNAGSSGSGEAQAVPITADTGYFWFFSAANIEVVVKVLDGCLFNDSYWVFAGGLTDVEVMLAVTDTQTGRTKTYTNPFGTKFSPIQDTRALAVCP